MGSTPVSPPQARPLGRLQASGRGVVGVIGPFPLLPAGLGTRPCGCVVTGRAASADLALALTLTLQGLQTWASACTGPPAAWTCP